MDRLILVVNQEGQTVNRIHLQKDAVNKPGISSPDYNLARTLNQMPADFQAAYNALIAIAIASFNGETNVAQEKWNVTVDISNDPGEATITRKAFANIPSRSIIEGHLTYLMPVLVRHYRDGVHIESEKADFVEIFKATNAREIEVGGVMKKEALHFEELGQTVPMVALMSGQIQAEDAIGRFNKGVVVA